MIQPLLSEEMFFVCGKAQNSSCNKFSKLNQSSGGQVVAGAIEGALLGVSIALGAIPILADNAGTKGKICLAGGFAVITGAIFAGIRAAAYSPGAPTYYCDLT